MEKESSVEEHLENFTRQVSPVILLGVQILNYWNKRKFFYR